MLALVVVVACRAAPEPDPTPRASSTSAPAASTSPSAAASSAAPIPVPSIKISVPPAGSVTPGDCLAFVARYKLLMKAQAHASLVSCGAKARAGKGESAPSDGELAAERDVEATLDEGVDVSAKTLLSQCSAQTGASYKPEDARCFVSATTASEWAGCKFVTPFFQSFTSSAAELDKTIQQVCDERLDALKKDAGG